MIYTLTLNPSIDYFVTLKEFKDGKTNRSLKEKIMPGGKGINVSIVLNNLNCKTKVLGFIGGYTGKKIKELIKELNIKEDLIEIKGNSRINVKIISKRESEINGNGPKIESNDLNKLYKKLDKLNSDDTLVISGSAPSENKTSIYADIVSYVSNKGIKVVVDTTGDYLLKTLKYKPFLIKPNKKELEALFNVKINSKEEIIKYMKLLKKKGAKNIIVSLGKDGAILLDENNDIYYEKALKGKAVNTVGAGDTLVAGFIYSYEKINNTKKAFEFAVRLASIKALSKSFPTLNDIK